MKWFKRIALVLVLLVVATVAVFYFARNTIVKRIVESQASDSLNLATTLDSASLSLFGGSFALNDLRISSPAGFSSPQMFTLGGVKIDVNYGELRSDPIRVESITISKPKLVIEQKDGKFNIKAVMDQQSKTPPVDKPNDNERQEGEPVRLVIGEVRIEEATVSMLAGLPGLDKPIDVTIPSFTLRNVGRGDGSQNGAAIKEVVMEVVTALAAKGMDAGNLPDQLRSALASNVQEVAGKLSGEFNKQVKDLSKTLDSSLKGLPIKVPDLGKGTEDLTKGLDRAIEGLGGKEKEKEKKK